MVLAGSLHGHTDCRTLLPWLAFVMPDRLSPGGKAQGSQRTDYPRRFPRIYSPLESMCFDVSAQRAAIATTLETGASWRSVQGGREGKGMPHAHAPAPAPAHAIRMVYFLEMFHGAAPVRLPNPCVASCHGVAGSSGQPCRGMRSEAMRCGAMRERITPPDALDRGVFQFFFGRAPVSVGRETLVSIRG